MSKWPYNTSTWRRLREAKLSDQPLCEACLRRERVEPAVAVDHIDAIAAGGDPFPPLDKLMSMCLSCHNSKTNAIDHPSSTGFRRALKGFDVDGNPIDSTDWEPGAEAGRDSAGWVPASGTQRYLLTLQNNKMEDDRWV